MGKKRLCWFLGVCIFFMLLLTVNGVNADGHCRFAATYGSAIALPGLEITEEIIMGYLSPKDPAEFHNYDFVCDNVIFFDVASNAILAEGKEMLIQSMNYIYTMAFEAIGEDFNITIGNGCAVLEWTIVGTHIGEFAGVPATGNLIRVPMIAVYELDKRPPHLITSARVYMMNNILMEQIAQ